MKKFLKYTLRGVLAIVLLLFCCLGLLYVPAVQETGPAQPWAPSRKSLRLEISVERFRLRFPLRLAAEQIGSSTAAIRSSTADGSPWRSTPGRWSASGRLSGVRSRTSGGPLPGYGDGIRVANCGRAVRHRAAAGRPAARKGCRPARRAGQRRHPPPSREADSRREPRLRHRPLRWTIGLDTLSIRRTAFEMGAGGSIRSCRCSWPGVWSSVGAARQPAGGRSPRRIDRGDYHLFRCTSAAGTVGISEEAGAAGAASIERPPCRKPTDVEPFGSGISASTGNNVRTVEHPDREAGVSREPGCLRCLGHRPAEDSIPDGSS